MPIAMIPSPRQRWCVQTSSGGPAHSPSVGGTPPVGVQVGERQSHGPYVHVSGRKHEGTVVRKAVYDDAPGKHMLPRWHSTPCSTRRSIRCNNRIGTWQDNGTVRPHEHAWQQQPPPNVKQAAHKTVRVAGSRVDVLASRHGPPSGAAQAAIGSV
jgi:hypothetical protein